MLTRVDCSAPGLPVHHQLLEFTQTHVHWVGEAIQPTHPLSSPSPPAFSLSHHQSDVTEQLNWIDVTVNKCQRKKSKSYPLCLSYCLLTVSPSFYEPLDSSRGASTGLEAWAGWVPFSASWELKPAFYFLQTQSPCSFIQLQWAETAKILVSNNTTNLIIRLIWITSMQSLLIRLTSLLLLNQW